MTMHHTQLRIRISGDSQRSLRLLLEELAESCRVMVKAIAPIHKRPDRSLDTVSTLDIELSGPLEAVQCWLKQLGNYPLTIRGRGYPDGDGWYC